MNERIEYLMYQAGLTAQGCWDQMDDYDKQAIEKFAQLIVQECIKLNGKELAMAAHSRMLNIYYDHFGVEE